MGRRSPRSAAAHRRQRRQAELRTFHFRGFEILTAPFVIAHSQLHLLLSDLGAEPRAGERPAVFLTNALTGWHHVEQRKLKFLELQAERDASQAVKTEARIIVIGNSPYNRFAGAPVVEELTLVDPYKGIRRGADGRQVGRSELFTRWRVRKHLLDDLYIRFFRLAEERIGHVAEYGVVSFISNSSYLAGRSHPIMRESFGRRHGRPERFHDRARPARHTGRDGRHHATEGP